jgi:hypothetical protein
MQILVWILKMIFKIQSFQFKTKPIGVCHADELLLMFTSNLIPLMTDPNDIKMSKMLLDLWTSFTANG